MQRSAEARLERLDGLAAELKAANVDVIVTFGYPAAANNDGVMTIEQSPGITPEPLAKPSWPGYRKISSRLPARSAAISDRPVTLLPGRARLSTPLERPCNIASRRWLSAFRRDHAPSAKHAYDAGPWLLAASL